SGALVSTREERPVHELINPPGLPKPAAPYSNGVRAGELVFVAGQLAIDDSGKLVGEGDIGQQTRKTIENVESVLREAGSSLDEVASTTVYLTSFEDYGGYNRVYAECFGENRPARATIRADLVLPGALVEIQAIALRRA